MYLCKNFNDCNVPVCPLDSEKDGIRLKEEKDKCKLSVGWRKKYRRIAQKPS